MLLFKRSRAPQEPDMPNIIDKSRLFNDYVKQADAARDQKRWEDAVTLYKSALLQKNNSDISIQLGHCLKELERFEEAWGAYRYAEVRMPLDDDLQLQIGHLEKLRGNRQSALHHYHAAIALNPANVEAKTEFANLDAFDIKMDLNVIEQSPELQTSNEPSSMNTLPTEDQTVSNDHPVIGMPTPAATLMSIGLRNGSYIRSEPTSFERDIMTLERALVRGYAPPK